MKTGQLIKCVRWGRMLQKDRDKRSLWMGTTHPNSETGKLHVNDIGTVLHVDRSKLSDNVLGCQVLLLVNGSIGWVWNYGLELL